MKRVRYIASILLVILMLTGCNSSNYIGKLKKVTQQIVADENKKEVVNKNNTSDNQKSDENQQSKNNTEEQAPTDSKQGTGTSDNSNKKSTNTKSELEKMAADVTVNTVEQYSEAVYQAIRSGKTKVMLKVTNFDAAKYDDSPAKLGGDYNTRYSGYSFQGTYIDKLAVLTFEFTYLTVEQVGGEAMFPDSNPILVSSFEQYCSEVQKALKEFRNKITFRINNYNNSFTLDVVNKYWREEPLRYSTGISVTGNVITNSSSSVTLVITINYTDKNGGVLEPSTMLRWRTEAESKAQSIVAAVIKPGMTDLEKEKALHDYVVKNASYENQGTVSHTDYGVLVEGKGVCESYAKAMYRLLNMVGVRCKLMDGNAGGEAHQWNLVQIGGVWYHLDATWNDPVGAPAGYVSHKYFNLTEEQIRKTHSW